MGLKSDEDQDRPAAEESSLADLRSRFKGELAPVRKYQGKWQRTEQGA